MSYYGPGGEIIDEATWAGLYSSGAVPAGHTEIGRVVVSTFWYGLPQNPDRRVGDPPLIWDTRVLVADEEKEEETLLEHYASEAQARKGHERWVAAIRAGSRPPPSDRRRM